MAARLAGVPALDMVTLDFGDDDRYATEAAPGAGPRLRRQAVHPPRPGRARQRRVPPVRRGVDWAGAPAGGFDAAGGMTIAFEGLMVDEVVAARARAILADAAR